MANIIKAGNASGGFAVTPDSTGILQLKTGAVAGGTTALTLDASQNATLAAALAVTGALSAASMTSGGSPVATTAGFVGSLTPTGYQKFPGGFTIQWIAPSSGGTKSWPIAFTTAAVGAWYIGITAGSSTDNSYVSALSTTSVTISQTNTTPNGYIIGIGY
jgi:hypothetical protein